MILAIDVGNTNIKIGVFDNDKLVDSYRLSAAQNRTSDEYGFYLLQLMKEKGISASDIDGVILSSVNPNLNYTVTHLAEYCFKRKPLVVGAGIKTGLNIKYDNPKEVGSDRIVNSVAAYQTYGGPCIIVDCGTATTFNVVSAKCEFLGGAISFGLKNSTEALMRTAAKLPGVELVKPEKAIGKTTISNMQSGIIFGYVGMVEYMVKKLKAEINTQCKVIATGGLSEIVSDSSDIFDYIDRTLTLRGLNHIYRINEEKIGQ